jgi:hypothetical protein
MMVCSIRVAIWTWRGSGIGTKNNFASAAGGDGVEKSPELLA